jgi:rhodanese-related sulfurtransferase
MNGLSWIAILTILIVLYNLYMSIIIYNHEVAILPGSAKKQVQSGTYDHILDVRMKDAWEQNHFPDAISIPLHQISMKTLAENEIQSNETILIYSDSNVCAYRAYKKLKKLSFVKVYYLLGSYINLI